MPVIGLPAVPKFGVMATLIGLPLLYLQLRKEGIVSMSSYLYDEVSKLLREQKRVALVTVVKALGSTPRGMSAKMLVDSQGLLVGTIGGGCPEAEAWQEAINAANGAPAQVMEVSLADDGSSPDGLICGGQLTVLIEPICAGSESANLMQQVTEQLEGPRNSAVMLVGLTDRPGCDWLGRRWAQLADGQLLGPEVDGQAAQRLQAIAEDVRQLGSGNVYSWSEDEPHKQVYAELVKPAWQLVIAGAGHVSRPLCRIAAECGYQVTVVDDRREFANRENFPDAHSIVCAPYFQYFSALNPSSATSIVLVTRGHKHDEECVRALAQSNGRPLYLGMIGSRRRTKIVMERLQDEGVSLEWLRKIYAPIGLDLGGETPAEIAVAIMAEIIAVRCGGRGVEHSMRLDI